jgi:hypothetical protein
MIHSQYEIDLCWYRPVGVVLTGGDLYTGSNDGTVGFDRNKSVQYEDRIVFRLIAYSTSTSVIQ